MSKGNYGKTQGDMTPHVEDYQLPKSDFSQEGFSKTTQYVERQDKHQNQNARAIERKDYKGRYS